MRARGEADRAQLAGAGADETVARWCPECGPRVALDEDGCCAACGNGASGPGADAALHLERQFAEVKATAERFRQRFRKAEAAIAKARRLMRSARKAPSTRFADFDTAYEALDWRNR